MPRSRVLGLTGLLAARAAKIWLRQVARIRNRFWKRIALSGELLDAPIRLEVLEIFGAAHHFFDVERNIALLEAGL